MTRPLILESYTSIMAPVRFEIRFKIVHGNPSCGKILVFSILERKHDNMGIRTLDNRGNQRKIKIIIKGEENLAY